nr:uroporphyrinogen decarboxylase family protein [bacterium]
KSKELYENTQLGIVGLLGGGGLGDVATIPGPGILNPTGIRRMDDWLVAHMLYPDYLEGVFAYQTEVMLKNLEIYHQAVGERVQVIQISGTDFGTQNAPFLSCELFRSLYKPFYQRMNGWVHQHTGWKTFFHSCGSVAALLEDLIDCGMDILNPVQISAAGMEAQGLKDRFGSRVTFWGAGVDTQKTLPFGTPEEVRTQVMERLNIFEKDGGFVFASIHNIVANTPPENVQAMFKAYLEYYNR